MAVERLMLSQLYLETFIEFYDLAKRTQQAGIEFVPLVAIAGFNTITGKPHQVSQDISHFKGMIPNKDAFLWWNVFFRLTLTNPQPPLEFPALKMRLHPKGYGTEIINLTSIRHLESEMNYIISEELWGEQLMGLCQEWKQFLDKNWYPPGLNQDMVKILNNIFIFGGGEIPVYISTDDWDRFVKTEIQKEGHYPAPWKSDFSPWQWDWAWCDVDALVPLGSLPRTKREYVFTREKIGPDSQGNSADMFVRVTEIDALEVLETLRKARNPKTVRSLNYPRGL